MTDEPTHRDRALEAIETAEQGGPESATAHVYATVAVAQAVLAVHDVLVDIRNEIHSLKTRLS